MRYLKSIILFGLFVFLSNQGWSQRMPYRGPCKPNDKCQDIVFKIPLEYILCIEDSVVDFQEWAYMAIDGKFNKSKHRIIQKEIMRSIENKEDIPRREEDILDKVFRQSKYKKRRERELE